jgi:predicted DNA-binding transcriptional regulator AlpA
MQTILDQKRVASLLGISTRTLERYRVSGTGPRYVKLGKLVRYLKTDIDAWIQQNLSGSTSERSAS